MKKNKKKTITITLLLVICFLGSCTTKATEINPIDLGTISYRDYEYRTIHTDHEINLSFVSCSCGVEQNDLLVEKIAFYPSLNDTKYRFSSQNIEPDPYFISGNKTFIYQDLGSGRLYIINVDYNDINIPKSKMEIQYQKLLSNYSNLSFDYGNLTEQYQLLDNITKDINNTLQNKTDRYIALYKNYNDTVLKLEKLRDSMNNLTLRYSYLLNNYTMVNNSYNTTYHKMIQYSTNLSAYQRFIDKLDGVGEGFYWDNPEDAVQGNQYYYTPYYYSQRIEKLENELGMTPIYIMLTIVFSIITAFIISRRYIDRYTKPYKDELPQSEKSQYFTKKFLTTLKDTFHIKKNVRSSTTKTPDNGKPSPTTAVFEQKLDSYQQKTNQQISNIDNKIDQILAKNGYSQTKG